jgi:hypothetical protein
MGFHGLYALWYLCRSHHSKRDDIRSFPSTRYLGISNREADQETLQETLATIVCPSVLLYFASADNVATRIKSSSPITRLKRKPNRNMSILQKPTRHSPTRSQERTWQSTETPMDLSRGKTRLLFPNGSSRERMESGYWELMGLF